MADRYWVGGAGTWNLSSTTNWSATSGGAGGASVPTAADSVFFDQAATYTVTCTDNLVCLNFTVSAGTVTFATGLAPTFTISGSLTLLATTIPTALMSRVTFNSSLTGNTITTSGISNGIGNLTFNGTGSWTLNNNYLANAYTVSVLSGTFNTGNYNLTCNTLTSIGTNIRAINLGSSQVVITTAFTLSGSNFSFNAGTSDLSLSYSPVTITGPLTFYNLFLTSTTTGGTVTINGNNIFNRLVINNPNAAGVKTVIFNASQTINGQFQSFNALGSIATQRVLIKSGTLGISQNLKVNGAISLTDCDFQDLYITGTSAPISGTRIGNLGGCNGITFSTPKTVYWNLAGAQNWTAVAWTDTPTGVPNHIYFPLAQDTAVFTNSGSVTGTITLGSVLNIALPTIDMSGRTTAMTLTISAACIIYGNWLRNSAVTLLGTSSLTFSGRNIQTIANAGTFPYPILVDSFGGTVKLGSALTTGSSITITNGIFDTQGYALSLTGTAQLISSNTNIRAINLRSSTVSIVASIPINFGTSTNLTFDAGTSQINVSSSTTTVSTGSGVTFYNFTSSNVVVLLTFSSTGPNIFNNLTIAGRVNSGVSTVSFSSNQIINGTLTISAGTAATCRTFIKSDILGTTRILTCAAFSGIDIDFCDIKIVGAAAPVSGIRLGDCGGNTGITFPIGVNKYWTLAAGGNWNSVAWTSVYSENSPFGSSYPGSIDINGSSGFLELPDYTTATVGTISGNFTFEAWVRPTSYPQALSYIFCAGDDRGGYGLAISNTGGVRLSLTPSAGLYSQTFDSATGLISLNTWYHIAATRSGSTVKVYLNGIEVVTGTNSTTQVVTAGGGGTATLKVGRMTPISSFTYGFVGNISNIRIINGTAIYTSNFTPSNIPLTAISGTSLFIEGINPLSDTSSNALPIVVIGGSNANSFPLAQDTCIFQASVAALINAGSVSIPNNNNYNIGAIDMSARTTNTMTLSTTTTTCSVYGDWINGLGTTLGGTIALSFLSRNTQIITSSGKTFTQPIIINNINGTTQLADALITSTSLTVTSGTFDAVSYNVTTPIVTLTFGTYKMGSGTWTLSGTGVVWTYTAGTMIVNDSNILLSNNTVTARTFAGGGQYYNKITIGGTTGISTTTFTGNNTIGELASIKTTSHAIAFGTTTPTFGKWSVSGTVGNVVTVAGTGAITIAGARVSGVNYLAMGTTPISTTSPGEFYAGPNSSGTGAGVILTDAPAPVTRYWVAGTGVWDATSTIFWSATSGGTGGASVPTSVDTVIFDANSSPSTLSYTVTCTATQLRCGTLIMSNPTSGQLIWAGSAPIAIHKSFSMGPITRNNTGLITLSGSDADSRLNLNATMNQAFTLNGIGSNWTLDDWLSLPNNAALTITNGNLNTNGKFIGCSLLQSNNSNKRSISLGNSSVSLASSTTCLNFGTTGAAENLTFDAGTSSILTSGVSSYIAGGGKSFYNIYYTGTSGVPGLDSVPYVNNLSLTNGRTEIVLYGDTIVNGTLTRQPGSDSATRTMLRSNILGVPRTLTCNAVSLIDTDFRDITIAGSAAPVSGTRLGDCKGNSGITFSAGVNKYWNLPTGGNWSQVAWALTSGGTPSIDNFPLAQDTVIFENTGLNDGATSTIFFGCNIGTIDMSARTTAMTLATGGTSNTIYGNWINGINTTITGSTGSLTFSGRNAQTITSAGKSFAKIIYISTPQGSVTLQDAFTNTNAGSITFILTEGNFNTNGFNFTLSGGFQSSGTNTRSFTFNGSTYTTSVAGQAWDTSISNNLSIVGSGVINLTSSNSKGFYGGSISYSGVTLNQGGLGPLTIAGNNIFKDITNSYGASGASSIILTSTIQTVQQFTGSGTSGKLLTISGSNATSPAILILTGTTKPNVDFLNISNVRVFPLSQTWYAGDNSVDNGSLGWYFESSTAPPPVVGSGLGNFLMFF